MHPKLKRCRQIGDFRCPPYQQQTRAMHMGSRNKRCANKAATKYVIKTSSYHASDALKAISNERRLLLVCLLYESEKSVSELIQLLNSRQARVSQQLAYLRGKGVVATRRAGKCIYYSLAGTRTARTIASILDVICLTKRHHYPVGKI